MTKNASGFEVSLDNLKEAQTEEELNTIRKKLLKDWHPDFFTHSESVKKVAEKIAKDINEAYNAELLRIRSGEPGRRKREREHTQKKEASNPYQEEKQRQKQRAKNDVNSHQNFTIALGKGVMLEMIAIPGGTFWMGQTDDERRLLKEWGWSIYDNERPCHQVTVAPFYIGKYPVTQAQWQAVMGNNPSDFKGADRPVECVSWDDCQEFVKKLNANPSHSPLNQGGQRGVFRLPSEAEWEYACRAGTHTMYSFGDDPARLGDYAWFDDNFNEQTHPVGQLEPNAFGLYDMHGNVWEWVADTYRDNYNGAPTDGSAWGSLGDEDEKEKVLRGGSWDNRTNLCRSACRDGGDPVYRYNNDGCRVVAVLARTL